MFIHPLQVREALKNAKQGKASGPDPLATEHFLFANGRICFYLALLYSSMLTHSYLSDNFFEICDCTNYKK